MNRKLLIFMFLALGLLFLSFPVALGQDPAHSHNELTGNKLPSYIKEAIGLHNSFVPADEQIQRSDVVLFWFLKPFCQEHIDVLAVSPTQKAEACKTAGSSQAVVLRRQRPMYINGKYKDFDVVVDDNSALPPDAIAALAGIMRHEFVHLETGDDVAAYQAQLELLTRLKSKGKYHGSLNQVKAYLQQAIKDKEARTIASTGN